MCTVTLARPSACFARRAVDRRGSPHAVAARTRAAAALRAARGKCRDDRRRGVYPREDHLRPRRCRCAS